MMTATPAPPMASTLAATPPQRRLPDFVALWAVGLVHPTRAFLALGGRPAPWWGLEAVVVRFVGTSLTTTLALLLLGRRPFTPPYLTFIGPDRYYLAELFFMPLFGLAVWLLMGGAAHLALRLGGHPGNFDLVLNVVGVGMLVPMALLWLADWAMIATDTFRLPQVAVIHATVELWEVLLFAIGFRVLFGLRRAPAVGLGLTLGAGYVGMAMIFAR